MSDSILNKRSGSINLTNVWLCHEGRTGDVLPMPLFKRDDLCIKILNISENILGLTKTNIESDASSGISTQHTRQTSGYTRS